MAEQKERAEKPAEKARLIKCEGPVGNNGASFYRIQREKGGHLDIGPGAILIVGEQINQKEAEQLLAATSWKFSEVK